MFPLQDTLSPMTYCLHEKYSLTFNIQLKCHFFSMKFFLNISSPPFPGYHLYTEYSTNEIPDTVYCTHLFSGLSFPLYYGFSEGKVAAYLPVYLPTDSEQALNTCLLDFYHHHHHHHQYILTEEEWPMMTQFCRVNKCR